jgi:serine protease Do
MKGTPLHRRLQRFEDSIMLKLRSRLRRPAFAAALLAATAVSGIGVWQVAPAFAQAPAINQTEHTAPIDTAHPAAQALPGFADLVQRVSPAVVTVSTTMRQQADDQASPFPPGSPQDRMFGQFFGGGRQGPAQVVHALGSGFIVDADGHIVTNNHVVKDATDIQITLADGRKLPAKVVGVDPKTDLAVLQVKSDTPLPHLALGDSNAARVGDWVVAVGNPFGLGGTVTAGILSARGRQIGQGPYDDFLQIDAPINRGNSGGPLFAQDGTVIGVNTAIYSPSGGSVGIGFAIPASVVKQVVGQLESNGKVERGWLGVSAQPVSPSMAKALHLGTPDGALVAEVQDSSPAAEAGIQPGDVITKVGTQKVQNPSELARIVAGIQSGTQQDVIVHRDGQDKTVNVKVASLPDQGDGNQTPGTAQHGARLGLALAPLDDQARQELNIPAGHRGVVIAQVQPDSPAATAGLQPGDVLEMVGNVPVSNPQQAVKALRDGTKAQGAAVALRVLRDGHQAFIALSAQAADQG